MKKFLKIFLIICLIIFTRQGAFTKPHFFSDSRDIIRFLIAVKPMPWSSLQETGGIKIGHPTSLGETTIIPVVCDVSGLSSTTRTPTTMNSGTSVKKTQAKVVNGKILISVYPTIISEKYNSLCKPVEIKDLKLGKYEVYYHDDKNYFLGKITVK